MLKNLKSRKEVNTQKVNTLDAIVAAIGDAETTKDKMSSLINSIENLLFEIQKRSGVLCSKNLRFNDYNCNPPKDLLTNSGEALVALGRFRSNLKNASTIDQLEDALLEVQTSAGFAASIKNTQTNLIGLGVIMDSACALALLGRLRLEQCKLIEEETVTKVECGCDEDCKDDDEEPVAPAEEPVEEPVVQVEVGEVVVQVEDDDEDVVAVEEPGAPAVEESTQQGLDI